MQKFKSLDNILNTLVLNDENLDDALLVKNPCCIHRGKNLLIFYTNYFDYLAFYSLF